MEKFKSQTFLNEFQLKINKDFEDPELFDIVFEIDRKKLYAHKYRLSTMSTTFKAMLSDRWNSNKNEPIVIKYYKFEDFKEFLCFLYTGECSITDENIYTMLDVAEFYHVNHLKELFDEYLSKMKYTFDNFYNMLEISNKYTLVQFKQALQLSISRSFSDFVKTITFFNADELKIEELIVLCSNFVKPEIIFRAVYLWSEHQALKRQEESIADDFDNAIKAAMSPFLSKIQFKKMQLKFLHQYVVTITNANGESIYCILDTNTHAKEIDIIQSLTNRSSDNGPNIDALYWNTGSEIPSTPNTLYKRDGFEWHLVYFQDGDVGVRKNSANDYGDYLLAEMFCEGEFSVTTNCKIVIE